MLNVVLHDGHRVISKIDDALVFTKFAFELEKLIVN